MPEASEQKRAAEPNPAETVQCDHCGEDTPKVHRWVCETWLCFQCMDVVMEGVAKDYGFLPTE